MGFTSTGIFAAAFAVVAYFSLYLIPRNHIPKHMHHHVAQWIPEFLSEEQRIQLNDIIRDMAQFPSNVDADLKTGGFVAKHEHIGEATPIVVTEDGQRVCNHPYLVPNVNRTHCILPQRIDIGKHFIITGGPDAIREPYEQMVARVSSFGRYMLSENVLNDYPVVANLFAQESFQNAAKSICPSHQQTLDPFQFNFIIQVPGQTVATHIDGAYFWGATRKEFPQWLLACMVYSGLYQDQFINQVQVVGYLHQWEPALRSGSNGDFVYYADASADPIVMQPVPRSGALIDGSKTVHAAKVYRKEVLAPKLDKNAANVLTYVGNETWHLIQSHSNDKEKHKIIAIYSTDDLRISIVYRARCFASEEEKEKYYELQRHDEEKMRLDDILEKLKMNMANKSSKYSKEKLDQMPTLDLAFALLDYYVAYPLPSASRSTIPYNYCVLSKLLPWTASILSIIC